MHKPLGLFFLGGTLKMCAFQGVASDENAHTELAAPPSAGSAARTIHPYT